MMNPMMNGTEILVTIGGFSFHRLILTQENVVIVFQLLQIAENFTYKSSHLFADQHFWKLCRPIIILRVKGRQTRAWVSKKEATNEYAYSCRPTGGCPRANNYRWRSFACQDFLSSGIVGCNPPRKILDTPLWPSCIYNMSIEHSVLLYYLTIAIVLISSPYYREKRSYVYLFNKRQQQFRYIAKTKDWRLIQNTVGLHAKYKLVCKQANETVN